ncbi:Meiosis-specific serine/threonine-protein kinase mek1 [Xylographa bjoerkii]|nr:Meiosis-specific serine/threonine-protein kinase mek1 [Xylographa bjoerkii]
MAVICGSPAVVDTGSVLVGTFEIDIISDATDDFTTYDIHLRERCRIGRDRSSCDITFHDPAVSNCHVNIYSIMYDDDSQSGVQPLVYAEDLSGTNGTYWNKSLIGKGKAALLSHGDELRLGADVCLTFRTVVNNDNSTADHERDETQLTEIEHFKEKYDLTNRKLGEGRYGKVYMAVNRQLGRQLACKVVDLRAVRRDEAKKWRNPRTLRSGSSQTLPAAHTKLKMDDAVARHLREVEILKHLDHANIIRIEKVYQTENTVYIFEELMTGGDLFSFLEYKGGTLDEAGAGVIVHQILEGLTYLHNLGIVHRDLKPENILMQSLADAARVVLTDFGCAIKIAPTGQTGGPPRRLKTMRVGTPGYSAPEVSGRNPLVKEQSYTKAVDLWSLGCVTVLLLTGSTPFSKGLADRRATFEAISDAAAKCDLSPLRIMPQWRAASESLQDFMEKLLVLKEASRMTAQEALLHLWFNGEYKEDWDSTYRFSVKEWKARTNNFTIVETIKAQTMVNKSQGKKATKLKALKPIEPHYKPFHRQVDRFITSVRNLGTLPTILEIAENKKQLPSLEMLSIHDSEPGLLDESNGRSGHSSEGSHTGNEFLSASSRSQTSHYFNKIQKLSTRRTINSQIEIFETPARETNKRPLENTQESPSLSAKRKRRSMADFDNMEVTLGTPAVTDSPLPQTLSTNFTLVNRRQSVKLGDLHDSKRAARFPSLVSEGELASAGHDGPLVSKLKPSFSRAQHNSSGKYPFPQPSVSTSTSSSSSSITALVRAPAAQTLEERMATPASTRRPLSSFDWEEHNLKAEESMENRGFRSARGFDESIQKRKARKVNRDKVSADLSDSIRTAYE